MLQKTLLLAVAVGIASFSSASAQIGTKGRLQSIDSVAGNPAGTHSAALTVKNEPHTQIINADLVSYILALNVSWVHALSEGTAADIGVELGFSQPAWGISGEFRIYPGKKSLRGFYYAPIGSLIWSTPAYYDESTGILQQPTQVTLDIGAVAGWQWFPTSDFALGFALGFESNFPLTGNPYRNDLVPFSQGNFEQLFPVLQLNVGYGW